MLLNKGSEGLRRWEDLASMGLGIVAAAAPWFYYSASSAPLIVFNALVVGIVIALLAALDLYTLPHWEEPFEMLCGAWLMVAPYWLGYGGGTLGTIHVAIGALVLLLAAAELWQDRNAA